MADKTTAKRYGIANVLVLLRELPIDSNPELVMRVVRKTLESNQVRVEDLVAEAKASAGRLEEAIGTERASITELEREIAAKNAVVAKLREELNEMKRAGERLAGALSGVLPASEWDRPSVMRLEDGDLESVPAPEPRPRGKGPPR